jgi:hypothetical protein
MIISEQGFAEVEQRLFDKDYEADGTSWEAKTAQLFAYDGNDSTVFIARYGDVYELLDAKNSVKALAKLPDTGIVLITHGWASPVSKEDDEFADLKPSKHPQRRRVRLTIAHGNENCISKLRFSDEPNDVLTETGGEGSLKEACATLIDKVSKQQKKAGK